ncbi:hypothetical protein IID26_00065 [Patescibacteria group bacterium]|nr:hypothetical protein [Patescibacteria group bacterium]
MKLREQLDKIIHINKGENWWKPRLFKDITLPQLPKELKILEFPPLKNNNYNCFIHTLGLSKDVGIIKNSGGFIYDTFFQKLIDKKALIPTDHPKNGDYILYRDSQNYPDKITHSGVLDNGKVVSKWAWGPLLCHDVFDVPASYGDEISYIKAVDHKKARDLYWKYKKFNKLP